MIKESAPPRFVGHLDLDAFYCSVEVLHDPCLKDKPIVVGGRPDQRGVVAAASYAARKFGIHSATPMGEAVRLCEDLIIVPPNFKRYKTYSTIVMGIIRDLAPLVQQVSIDEAYFEMTDLAGSWESGIAVAEKIKQKITRDIQLSCSVGLGTSKMIAKIASDFQKPDGFTIVKPGTELAFLNPLNVQKIPGIGAQTTRKLNDRGIFTIQDLRNTPEKALMDAFGKPGVMMAAWSRAIDPRILSEDHESKSISQERTFRIDVGFEGELLMKLKEMAKDLADQLDEEKLRAKTVTIKLRYPDFQTQTRQRSFQKAIRSEGDIYRVAEGLLQEYWDPARPLRLLGLGVSGLVNSETQLSLSFI